MSSYICLAYKCFNTQYIHTYGKLAINYPTHACQSVFMYVCMKGRSARLASVNISETNS